MNNNFKLIERNNQKFYCFESGCCIYKTSYCKYYKDKNIYYDGKALDTFVDNWSNELTKSYKAGTFNNEFNKYNKIDYKNNNNFDYGYRYFNKNIPYTNNINKFPNNNNEERNTNDFSINKENTSEKNKNSSKDKSNDKNNDDKNNNDKNNNDKNNNDKNNNDNITSISENKDSNSKSSDISSNNDSLLLSINTNEPVDGLQSNSNNHISNDKNILPFEASNDKNIISKLRIPYIMIIGTTVLALALTAFIIVKKYKKKNNNKFYRMKETEDDDENNFNYSLLAFNGDFKEPLESCEEYLNSLSRLRYKDPTDSIYNSQNPYKKFSYFKYSPVLAPSSVHSISNSSMQNVYRLQPFMIDPQFENSITGSDQVNRSYSAKYSYNKSYRESRDTVTEIGTPSLKTQISSENTPFIRNDSFISSTSSQSNDVPMNLSIVNLLYNPDQTNISVPNEKKN